MEDLAGPVPPMLPSDEAVPCGVPESELPMTRMLPKESADSLSAAGHTQIPASLPSCARLKNTFLEFADPEEDPWLVRPNPRRQHTDSILDRSSHSLAAQLEQNIIETLQGHLALNSNPPSKAPAPYVSGLQRQHAEPRSRATYEIPFKGNVGEALPLPANFNGDLDPCLNKPIPNGLTRLHGSELPGLCDPDFYFEEYTEQFPFEAKFEAARLQQQQVLSAALAANGNPRQPYHPALSNPAIGTVMQRFQMNGEMPAKLFEATLEEYQATLEEDEEGGEASNQVVDPEVQARRDVAAAGGGLSGCTSIMVRHIPCKYTQRKLMREINGAGFLGRYDFFYLPMDPRSHANRGFAFLNFVNDEVAEDFYHMFHGQRLKHFNSEKVIAVMPADLQGFEQNAAHYAASRALRRKRAQHSKPVFFRPLPSHLTPDDTIEIHLDQVIFTGPMTDTTTTCSWEADSLKTTKVAPANFGAVRNTKAGHRGHHDMGVIQAAYGQVYIHGVGRDIPPLRVPYHGMQLEGAALIKQGPAKQPRFCPYCGHQRTVQHLFCPYCGSAFNE